MYTFSCETGNSFLNVLTESWDRHREEKEKGKLYETSTEPCNTFIKEDSRKTDRRCKSNVTLHRKLPLKWNLKGRMTGTLLLHDKMLLWSNHGPTHEELVVEVPRGPKVCMTSLVIIILVTSAQEPA